MSLEFMDGFEHDRGYYAMKWDSTSSNGGAAVAGRFGGYGIGFQNNPLYLTQNQLTSVATRTIGFAFYWNASGSATNQMVMFTDGGSTQTDLRLQTPAGYLVVTRNGTVLATSTQALPQNAWVYIEFQVTIGTTTGAYTVKVWSGPSPGTWLTASSVNTQATGNATTNGITFPNMGYLSYLDDLYVLNSSGSVNNTFLGESRIYTSMPSGDDASYKTWTPSAGTNHYANVSETPQDTDTTYNATGVIGNIDLFTYPSVTPSGAIFGVQSCLTFRKDDVGARTVSEQCKSGATVYTGSGVFSPSSSYLMFRQLRETDPNTSAAWVTANLNAAEFGIKLIS